jgi:hypothetical protein
VPSYCQFGRAMTVWFAGEEADGEVAELGESELAVGGLHSHVSLFM